MWDTNPLLLPLRPLLLLLLLRVDSDGRDLVAENRLKLLFLRELRVQETEQKMSESGRKKREREKKKQDKLQQKSRWWREQGQGQP